jgi:hypothetical protein
VHEQASEEAHWLRSACARNRARLIEEVAGALSLPVQTMHDLNAGVPTSMAACTTDTLHHDLYLSGDSVRVTNYVTETGTASNGVVCALAPWHGLTIFHGCDVSEQASDFGRSYGRGLLPTAMPCPARFLQLSQTLLKSYSNGPQTRHLRSHNPPLRPTLLPVLYAFSPL